jgi:hypothetical protein
VLSSAPVFSCLIPRHETLSSATVSSRLNPQAMGHEMPSSATVSSRLIWLAARHGVPSLPPVDRRNREIAPRHHWLHHSRSREMWLHPRSHQGPSHWAAPLLCPLGNHLSMVGGKVLLVPQVTRAAEGFLSPLFPGVIMEVALALGRPRSMGMRRSPPSHSRTPVEGPRSRQEVTYGAGMAQVDPPRIIRPMSRGERRGGGVKQRLQLMYVPSLFFSFAFFDPPFFFFTSWATLSMVLVPLLTTIAKRRVIS